MSDVQTAVWGIVWIAGMVIHGIWRCYAISRGYSLGVTKDGGEALAPAARRRRRRWHS